MTTFEDRENAFEAKFVHDEELRFKVLARRDRLTGQWAAAKLGKSGEDAEAYVKQVILADLEKPGDEDIVAKLVADLGPLGIDEAAVRAELAAQTKLAYAQIAGQH